MYVRAEEPRRKLPGKNMSKLSVEKASKRAPPDTAAPDDDELAHEEKCSHRLLNFDIPSSLLSHQYISNTLVCTDALSEPKIEQPLAKNNQVPCASMEAK